MSNSMFPKGPIRIVAIAVTVMAALLGANPAMAASPGPAELISRNAAGTDGANFPSYFPQISGDGKIVTFFTGANDLGPADAGIDSDLYWRDRLTGVTQLVSANHAGIDGGNSYTNNLAGSPAVSNDGRFVAFGSAASNLIAPGIDTNSHGDVYWRNMSSGVTRLVSSTGAGLAGNAESTKPSVSADGCTVAFQSLASLLPADTNTSWDVYSRNMCGFNTTLELVSVNQSNVVGNGDSIQPSISADGRYVAFNTLATNLGIPDNNGTFDVYRRDMALQQNRLVSADKLGTSTANGESYLFGISAHGTSVGFTTKANNLGYLDNNGTWDVYLWRELTSSSNLVSAAIQAQTTGNGKSIGTGVSDDGQFVSFESQSTNLHWGDTTPLKDVYRRSIAGGQTALVSQNLAGKAGNGESRHSVMSADGRFVAFTGESTNLVNPPGTGWDEDVFVRDLVWGTTTLISTSGGQAEADSNSGGDLAMSRDGRVVAFFSNASNLVTTDGSFDDDIYAATTAACTITGNNNANTLFGSTGRDVICGLGGNDAINASDGDDILDGGAGDDHLIGGLGQDSLSGFDGNDKLVGGSGVDSIFGLNGVDHLLAQDGGGISEYVEGGLDWDTCEFDSGDSVILCP
jgi:hypothetical protein